MGTYHNGKSLAAMQRRRAAESKAAAMKGHSTLANDCYQEAQRITSGAISTRTLRKLGHPYGRRAGSHTNAQTKRSVLGRQRSIKGGRARLPALPINKQSGRLKKAIKLYKRTATGNIIQTWQLQVLKQIAPHAVYVLAPGGTTRMIPRPFFTQVQRFWKKQNLNLLIKLRNQQRVR